MMDPVFDSKQGDTHHKILAITQDLIWTPVPSEAIMVISPA